MKIHYAFIGLFAILLPLNVCLEALQCIPAPALYSLVYIGKMKNPRQIKCLNTHAISLQCRIVHIVTDVALLCVPITIVFRLQQISWKKKLRLTSIFALGGMSTVASILRNRIIAHYLDDITWQYYEVYVWNYIDITFAVVVASLPALNRLVDAALSRIVAHRSSSGAGPSMPQSTRRSGRQAWWQSHSSDKSTGSKTRRDSGMTRDSNPRPSAAYHMEARPSTVHTGT
jgi:hypothetical protein